MRGGGLDFTSALIFSRRRATSANRASLSSATTDAETWHQSTLDNKGIGSRDDWIRIDHIRLPFKFRMDNN